MSFFDPTTNQGHRSIAELLHYFANLKLFKFYPPNHSNVDCEEISFLVEPKIDQTIKAETIEQFIVELKKIFENTYLVRIYPFESKENSKFNGMSIFLNDVDKLMEFNEVNLKQLSHLESLVINLCTKYDFTASPRSNWKERAFDPDRWK